MGVVTLPSAAWRHAFGQKPKPGCWIVFFSARLDESGTHAESPYAIVAGAVSIPPLWDELESKWNKLLSDRGVGFYHHKDFKGRQKDFRGWGVLKRKNFTKRQERIIRGTGFCIVVALHKDSHKAIKKRMQGVRGFKTDSDVGMCFRVARYLICKKLTAWAESGDCPTPPSVGFIVEDGPWAGDTAAIYQDIVGATGTPGLYADMLAGFATQPKGVLRSLEAADYIAGRALTDIEDGTLINPGRKEQIAQILDPDFMEDWHADLVKAQESRRSRRKGPNV
jgi:hypothetical protein